MQVPKAVLALQIIQTEIQSCVFEAICQCSEEELDRIVLDPCYFLQFLDQRIAEKIRIQASILTNN